MELTVLKAVFLSGVSYSSNSKKVEIQGPSCSNKMDKTNAMACWDL